MATSPLDRPAATWNQREAIPTESIQCKTDETIWDNLKQAIASSSGFQRWQTENLPDAVIPAEGLDPQVRRYLRETLETLAY